MAEQTFKSPGFFEREIEIISKPAKGSRNTPFGVIGTAEVLLKKEEHILVEEKSLYYVGDDVLMATLAEGNIVEKKKIKLGKRFKDKVEILEGINIGTPFVKASPKYLRDGEQVEVKEN